MNLEIYSVYDSKAEAYLPPFFMANEQTAQRVFFNASNDKQHQFGANPSDYGLFHIGSFDDNSAIIKPLKIPKSLGLAQEYVRGTEQGEPVQSEIQKTLKANSFI